MEAQLLVSVGLIDPNPYQPRQVEDPEAVTEIAASIKQNGLMQVPSARQVDGRYQLAFGHTRLAAYKLNSEDCMPLIVRDLSDLQMFELGVAENIKRRDLNYVEKAEAMQRYMEEFGKNSVETAEFFNATPEDVRGTVRLNNLPEDAKEILAKGEMTVTTARAILSMQKVASAEVVTQTIKRIEKGKDRWGQDERPEEAIQEVLSNLNEAQEFWAYNGAKPRSGRDGWLMDMKNFPNRFLPVLTPVDAAVALAIQNDQEMMDKVSIWMQAGAGELPDLDTESLGIPDELLGKLDHLINPPACNTCPFYSNVMGTHYCGMKTCFTRKTVAWDREKLRAAAKDLKIEIYNAETDGEFRVLEESYTDNGKKHAELFKKRSKDLRLALAFDIDRKKPQSGYQGVPSSSVVMVVGPTLKKLLETGSQERAKKRSKEQSAQLLKKLREEKRAALDWEVAGYVKIFFDGMNQKALQALRDAPGRYSGGWEINRHNLPDGINPSKDGTVSADEDFLRRIFALNMITKIGGYYNKTISEYAVYVSETVKDWGVKLPKAIMKSAAAMDEEIAAVTVETEA